MGIFETLGFRAPKTPESEPLRKPVDNVDNTKLDIGTFTPTEKEVKEAKVKGPEAEAALYEKFRVANLRKQAAASEKAIKETGDAISRDIEGGSDTTN